MHKHENSIQNKGQCFYQHSAIYAGHVRHRRFASKSNAFNYRLYMLALDLDEIIEHGLPSGVLGFSWFNPIRFVASDYLRVSSSQSDGQKAEQRTDQHATAQRKNDLSLLKQRIENKVLNLHSKKSESLDICRITMLVQARCFGVYFSPANFYFCYNSANQCIYMLAEVSNTPWNKRHYYLVDMLEEKPVTDKDFHVSPFMDLDMQYHWRIQPIQDDKDNMLIHIENRALDIAQKKLFDATLQMKKAGFTTNNLLRVWATLPAMTLKICAGIYWQALKLFIKRIPFVSYIESKGGK